MTKRLWSYLLCCVIFWFAALAIPIRWTSGFIPSDRHHIYNHCFYAALLCLGLLSKVYAAPRLGKAVLIGGLIGWSSSILSILAVTLSSPGGRAFLALPSTEIIQELGIWLLMSMWFGGPLIGAVISALCWVTSYQRQAHATY
jgi:hypothetical protein